MEETMRSLGETKLRRKINKRKTKKRIKARSKSPILTDSQIVELVIVFDHGLILIQIEIFLQIDGIVRL